jgi:hypothetical protein
VGVNDWPADKVFLKLFTDGMRLETLEDIQGVMESIRLFMIQQ